MVKPEDTNPSKPTGAPPPEKTPAPIPPSMRRKIYPEDEEDQQTPKAQALMGWIMLIAVVALIAVLFVMMQNAKKEEAIKAAEAARVAREQATADSISKAFQDSVMAHRADSLAQVTPKKPKPAEGGEGAEGAPVEPPARYGIDVGTYLNEDRAKAEQAKLQASTGLGVQILPVTKDNFTEYRVVVGNFGSQADATKRANELISSQAVREAKVTRLKAGG